MDSTCFSRALIGYSISEYPVLFTDSPPVPPSERCQPREIKVTSKMASRSAAVTNKEISQIIKQAVPQIHEEGEKYGLEVLTGKALSV